MIFGVRPDYWFSRGGAVLDWALGFRFGVRFWFAVRPQVWVWVLLFGFGFVGWAPRWLRFRSDFRILVLVFG